MKERTRNLAVGLTVLVGLALFCGMVLMFAGLPELLQTGRVLKLQFDDSAGTRKGEWLYMQGIPIGKVTDVGFTDNDPTKGVVITCRIDSDVKIPGDVTPRISTKAFGGGSYLALRPGGQPRTDPATGKPYEYLPEKWSEPLKGEFASSGLIPKKVLDQFDNIGKGFKDLSDLAATIKAVIGEPTAQATSGPAAQPGAEPVTRPAPATLAETLASFKRAMDAVDNTLGDKENQANLKKALADLAKAAGDATATLDAIKSFAKNTEASAGKTLAAASQAVDKIGTLAQNTDKHIGEISTKIVADAEELSKVLASINRIATKMESGDGTIPKMLNDPKLYDSFLEASQQLTELAAELRVLVKEWEKSGVPLKLK